MRTIILLILTMFIAFRGLAFSETFFWEDKKGIHMTDDVSKLPPKYREKYDKFIKQLPKQEVKKTETIPESAMNAVKSLKKLQARTQAGISYRDYPPALGEAKFEVNCYLDGNDSNKNPTLAKNIPDTTALYEYANSIWKEKYSDEAANGFIGIDSGIGKIIASTYFSRYPEDKKDYKNGGVLANELGGKLIIDIAVRKTLDRASQKMTEIMAIKD
ncbi:hypothetical protein HXX01_05355 [Candidatus Nomurabacteria bacterium]|nr:hypothetical protein [Candidatus Nomurabacteria bacterium]